MSIASQVIASATGSSSEFKKSPGLSHSLWHSSTSVIVIEAGPVHVFPLSPEQFLTKVLL